MRLQVLPRHCTEQGADLYTLAILLAEGQVGAGVDGWSAFIDKVSHITDALANARATADSNAESMLVSA